MAFLLEHSVVIVVAVKLCSVMYAWDEVVIYSRAGND